MNGKMWSRKGWDNEAETTLDLSYEANELGLIPLSCEKRLSPSGRKCSAKVFDAPQIEIRKGGIKYRRILCLLCGYEDWRKIGMKNVK